MNRENRKLRNAVNGKSPVHMFSPRSHAATFHMTCFDFTGSGQFLRETQERGGQRRSDEGLSEADPDHRCQQSEAAWLATRLPSTSGESTAPRGGKRKCCNFRMKSFCCVWQTSVHFLKVFAISFEFKSFSCNTEGPWLPSVSLTVLLQHVTQRRYSYC